MITDFLDAHARHWKDAELLFNQRRFANADHLYGLSAECGLKHLMRAFGMLVDEAGDLRNRRDKRHANTIRDRYESYRQGHARGADYLLPNDFPFSNWDINQRYAPQSLFTEPTVEPHRSGARVVQELVNRARLEGLV